MGGGIIKPRLDTPQELIRELIRAGADRCKVCQAPALKQGKLALIIGGEEYFCDAHSFADMLRFKEAKAEYTDVGSADLIRRAQKWLSENRIEEKT